MQSISHTPTGTCSTSSSRLPLRWCHRQRGTAVVARSDKGKQLINEDVLARLQAAEAEAARLRQELAAAQAAKGGPAVDVIEAQPKRIDSTDKRETLDFGNPQPRAAWLTEADVNFFIGAGTGEQPAADADSTTPEEKATVQRRLLIGGALTVGALAFGMIPTEKLRLRPSKPLFFYVVPLLRVQALLAECKPLIEDADWEALRFALARIKGNPNNVRDNLSNAVAWIDDAATAERANKLSLELFEYLESMDYNKYYEAMPTKVIGPAQNVQFVEFSGKALQAAQAKLQAFLALLPAEQVEAARTQLAQFSY